jgi:hypothetical protein
MRINTCHIEGIHFLFQYILTELTYIAELGARVHRLLRFTTQSGQLVDDITVKRSLILAHDRY